MIFYEISAKDGKISEKWKLVTPSQRDVAYTIYCMQQKINLLMSLEFNKDLEIKYPIDSDGNRIFEEDEGK